MSPGGHPSWGWGRWGWRTLTSMRTAVVLLALLAFTAVPGSVLPQRNVASDPAAVTQFTADHPTVSPWLERLGLFEVYASPWFAATYLLLLVSMTGCVLPRCLRLWRSARAEPPAAPASLTRLGHYQRRRPPGSSAEILAAAAGALRRRRFRVTTTATEVRAEKGFLREIGNLVFHLSLLLLLAGVAVDRLYGFEGRVALVEGATFSNVTSQYDVFKPSPFTDVAGMQPLTVRLDDLTVRYSTSPTQRGQPLEFTAEVAWNRPGEVERESVIRPNQPLDVDETKLFLTGNGYAPVVTVRDGTGTPVFTGPVIFLPLDANYASEGVVKVPDARPSQLGFEGFFLPTAVSTADQPPASAFPDLLNPRLVLTAYTGDLGLGSGIPQSVFRLDKSRLRPVRRGGRPVVAALAPGETMRLRNGSLTFDDVARFANLQIAYDPGKEISLAAALLLLTGLTVSLTVARRRVWVRVSHQPDGAGDLLEIGALSLSRRSAPAGDIDAVLSRLGAHPPATRADTPEQELIR